MSDHLPGNPYVNHPDAGFLAVAYELRTATLLQFLMWEPTHVSPFDDEIQQRVVRRLGLEEAS